MLLELIQVPNSDLAVQRRRHSHYVDEESIIVNSATLCLYATGLLSWTWHSIILHTCSFRVGIHRVDAELVACQGSLQFAVLCIPMLRDRRDERIRALSGFVR